MKLINYLSNFCYRIIPFVAADAVVNDDDMKGKTDEPIYFDYPQPSRFSPPSKTEGM